MNYLAASSDDYATFRARFTMDAYRTIVSSFMNREAEGLTRQELANRLGVHKSVISRRLSGATNLTLGVISDMARGMGYRPELCFRRYEDLVGDNASAILVWPETSVSSGSPPVPYIRVDKDGSSNRIDRAA
jgi:Helix-turn-helix